MRAAGTKSGGEHLAQAAGDVLGLAGLPGDLFPKSGATLLRVVSASHEDLMSPLAVGNEFGADLTRYRTDAIAPNVRGLDSRKPECCRG